MADSSVRDHHHSAPTTPAATIASRITASSGRPSTTSYGARKPAASGVQPRIRAARSAGAKLACTASELAKYFLVAGLLLLAGELALRGTVWRQAT